MHPVPTKLEWQRALTTLSAVAVFVLIVAALYWARSIFIPVALGVFLAFVMSPPVTWLHKRGLGRVPAVLVTVGLAVTVVAVVGGLVAWQLADLAHTLPSRTGHIKQKLTDVRNRVLGEGESQFGKAVDDIASVFSPPPAAPPQGVPTVVVQPAGSSWTAQAEQYVSPALEVAGQVAFGFVLSVFMLLKKEDLRNRLIRLTGQSRLTTTTKAVDDASRRISRYLLMQLIVNSTFGLLITVGLLLMGVSYAVVWGVLAAFMRYIPYLGTWLGIIPPAIATLALSDQLWQPIAVVALYATLEIVSNNMVEPWVYGSSMGLSEVAQMVAAAFWAFLWGPIGLVLSGPLTVCLLVLGKYSPRLEFLDVLLGDEPVLAPDVRVYQRLAARDQDEATEVARAELRRTSAEHVFDAVLVPALIHAKRDHDEHVLTEEDLAAMLQSMREITDEVIDSRLVAPAGAADPDTPRVRLLAVPARDKADEVALDMLRGLLDSSRWEVEVSPVERLTSEVVALAGELQPAVIVVGALPPGGLAHTRYLCKRIGRRFPGARVVVGRWGAGEADDEGVRLLTEAGADYVGISLAETVQHLTGWSAPLTSQQQAAEGDGESKSPAGRAVGTSSA